MKLRELKAFYNRKPVEFVTKDDFRLKEDKEYIPRFSLKFIKEVGNIPINQAIPYSDKVLITAIKYGMIFLISYKGEKDTHFSGHERVIYPMVLGKSSKGKTLLRGWHLNGWSVSNNRKVNKIWRMFRTDRILSLTFTGSFYRLPPSGYKMDDRGMRGGIIISADFNQIRRNQQVLVNKNEIQNKEDITIGSEKRKFATIRAIDTNTELDLLKPFNNAYINNYKNLQSVRIAFCRSIYGNKYIAILGAIGDTGNTVKVLKENGSILGVFKVLDSIDGSVLKKIKNIKGNKIYDLYIFDKKFQI